MPHRVTVKPADLAFEVRDGETVLDAALREHVIIAYGCRDGACGSCKGRLLDGRLDYGSYEAHALPEPERAAGMALFCQARPLSDIVIECRVVAGIKDIQIRTLPCRVEAMERLAADVMRLRLKLPANERLQFLPGQYIDILRDGLRRSFSMAHPPRDDASLELHLRNYGGPFSEHVFGRMKARDILRIEGPFGTFVLREAGTRPIVFVAGGTGFAPVKALIEQALAAGLVRPMTLYWGCRTRADLYLAPLAERWQQERGVHFVPVLSDATAEDRWSGRVGLVHRAVMEDFPDLSGHQVYACGAPAMVEAAQRDFTAQCGLPPEEFFSDSFTPSVP